MNKMSCYIRWGTIIVTAKSKWGKEVQEEIKVFNQSKEQYLGIVNKTAYFISTKRISDIQPPIV